MKSMRISKSPEERRAEIIETARRLFVEEGFADVSVSRIVGEIGVAQGTFYYYFATKEQALDAIVEDYIRELCESFDAIASDPAIDPRTALELMVRKEMGFDAERARELYSIKGGDVHTRLFSSVTAKLAPRYQAIMERGIACGAFASPCPDLIAETIILHVHFLFDRDVLGWSDIDYERRLTASARLLEMLLQLPDKSLNFLVKWYIK
jgi:AcrR family transcriptional regulator